MKNYTSTTIGEVCQTISESYSENRKEVILINTSDVYDGDILNHKKVKNEKLPGQFKKTFQKNDILYSEIRPANRHFAFVDINDTTDYIASTKLMVIRAKREKILPEFLYILLTLPSRLIEYQQAAETRSGTFPQITFQTEIAPTKILLPDAHIQRKIVHFIKMFTDKIKNLSQINQNLEAQAQAIFKSWFVDFEPFRNGKFVDSELGPIPEGWQVFPLDEVATFLNGLPMQKYRPLTGNVGLPVLKIKELREQCCTSESERCSEDIRPEYIVDDGDIIFSWSGSLLVDIWTGGRCGLNQHLFKVTSKQYEKWFYYLWTRHHMQNFISIAADKATTMGHIQRGHLHAALTLVPSEQEYSKLSTMLSTIIDRLIQSRIESRHLAGLRDTLLPKLMSGEIDVSDVEV